MYECGKNGAMNLVGQLKPFRDDGTTCEYVDMLQDLPGQSIRAYLYDLPLASAQTGPTDHLVSFRTIRGRANFSHPGSGS